MTYIPKILTIAASDPTSGAGIQGDIRTISALGCHPLVAITALTAQNTREVRDILSIPAKFFKAQLWALLEDILPDGIKIGMIYEEELIPIVKEAILSFKLKNIVLDPILKASTGRMLVKEKAWKRLKQELFPLVDVITPNLDEALALLGYTNTELNEVEIARALKRLGPNVVLTGGDRLKPVDILVDIDGVEHLEGERIEGKNTHGTGCMFSSALVTYLAKGYSLRQAARCAKNYTRTSIFGGYPIGSGYGIPNAFAHMYGRGPGE